MAPSIFYLDDPQRVWSAGGTIDWQRGVVETTYVNEPASELPAKPYSTEHVTGCCLLLRAEALRRAGLIDQRFFLYFEETEWCVRIARSGYQILVEPAAQIWHAIRPDEQSGSPAIAYYMTRNQLLFFKLKRGARNDQNARGRQTGAHTAKPLLASPLRRPQTWPSANDASDVGSSAGPIRPRSDRLVNVMRTKRPRIGIDARYLSHGLVGGVHTYIRSLTNALIQSDAPFDYDLWIDDKCPYDAGELPAGSQIRMLPWKSPLSSLRHDQRLGMLMRRAGADAVHFPANYGFAPPGIPTVVTLHDAINILPYREIVRGHQKKPRTLLTMSYLHLMTAAGQSNSNHLSSP